MELGDKDKFGQEKRGGDSVNYHSPGLSSDWRFGSSNLPYTFDGNLDTLVAALNRLGYGQMPIVIGEIGWPTDGALGANLTAARAFNQGVINHVLSNKGTPLRPGVPPMDKSCPSVGDCRFLVGISETKSSSFRHRHCWFLMWVITVWLFVFLRII